MSFLASSAVVLLAGVAGVAASPAPAPVAAPEPVITAAAILPRANTQTLGWYSDGQTLGQTIYAPWVFDADTTTYTTSGNWFRRCGISTTCVMYTGCSNGYMIAASSQSTYCGLSGATGGATTNYCSNHVILPTLGASTGALSWYWCDDAPLTGYTFYAKEPAQPTITDENSTPTRSPSAGVTSDSSNSVSNTASSSSTSPTSTPPPPGGSSTPVGAIAGGVVGGVAALAAIAFAIFFLLRRDKKRKAANAFQTAPLMGGTAPGFQPGQPGYAQQPGQPAFYDATAYQSEAKPQGVGVGGQPSYYPQSYPMGPYDPHVQQPQPQQGAGYVGSPGAGTTPIQELGADGGYAPSELPAQGKLAK